MSYSDVGKSFKNGTLTFKEYSEIENKYIQAVNLFLKRSGCDGIITKSVEKHSLIKDFVDRDRELFKKYEEVAEGKVFKVKSFTPIVQLILRDYLWCELHCTASNNVIRFGYDYYMYFSGDSGFKNPGFLKEIDEIGLFAE